MIIDDLFEYEKYRAAGIRGEIARATPERRKLLEAEQKDILAFTLREGEIACYAIDEPATEFLNSLAGDVEQAIDGLKTLDLPFDDMLVSFVEPLVKPGSKEVKMVPVVLHLWRELDQVMVGKFSESSPGEFVSNDLYLSLDNYVDTAFGGGDGKVHYHPSYYGRAQLLLDDEEGRAATYLEYTAKDVALSLPFVVAFLHFLQAEDRETVTLVEHDVAKLNKKRERAGKPLLHAHSVMRLGQLGREHMKAVKNTSSESDGRRAHFVRGHLMRSHGKLVWRRPHVRGVGTPEAPRIDVKL